MVRVTLRGLRARLLRLALTALAVVLGVTFVCGTLVLGDTLNRSFDSVVGTAFQHISFEVRGVSTLSGVRNTGIDSTANRRPIPASIATEIRRIPGVSAAVGSVSGYAQFVDHSGNSIGNGGPSALGFSFDANRRLSALKLVAGRAPTGPDDVVMDRGTALDQHFAIGDRVRVLLSGAPRTFTITGLITFGSDNNLAGSTLAGFDLATAQTLFNARGRYDTINVLAAPGADAVRVQRAIARTLPAGVQVVSGATVANELDQTIHHDLSFLSTALLVFACIALFVGGFTIFNTFSITVGQRTRELGLLRAVGASRGQVFRSVLAEAAATGLIASLVGIGLGVLAALGLRALLEAFGVTLPAAPLVFEARTVVAGLIVGVGVTVLSAIGPARRAVRIPAVAALAARDETMIEGAGGRRLWTAIAAATGALAALVAGLAAASAALVGVGALLALTAATLGLPMLARPLATALGRPVAAAFGPPGRLGRRNAARNPRRTAQTAAALMVGIGLVSSIAVLGSSLSASAKQSVDSAIRANYLIGGSIGTSVEPIVAKLPGVTATTTVYKGQVDIRGSLQTLGAVTPRDLDRTVSLQIVSGRGEAALAAGELLIDAQTASSDELRVGSRVPVTFAQTGPTTMRVGGIYAANPLAGSYITGAPFFLAHFDHPLAGAILIATTAGTHGFEARLNRVLAAYPQLSIQSRSEFEASQQASVNKLLGLVYALLALAVLVALIGIVNTLILSVLERTREIGLLRAVGMQRRQVRSMVRAESVIIALLGAVVGAVVGTGLGAAFADALRHDGVTTVSVPVLSLVLFVVLSAALGRGAAMWPGRRAANLDVLAAIATE